MIRQCILALLMLLVVVAQDLIFFQMNETATIPLPEVATYRRSVYVEQEHIYRVCNGKNAKTCGYWENIETKKKVPTGATTYNKNKKTLIIKKMGISDFGTYMTGDKKTKQTVYQQYDHVFKK